MSVINPNETSKTWRAHRHEPTVELYLSGVEGDSAALVGARIAGFTLSLNVMGVTDGIDPEHLSSASAAVIQVNADEPESVSRFQKLAKATKTPLIAAAFEPPLALVRSMVRAGAHDVVPLPLDAVELETSLAPIADALANQNRAAQASTKKIVSVIKGVGGAGATALLTQLAIQFAQSEAKAGRDVCLLDLDLQFGDAAFQLGLRPQLTLVDLIEAGDRLDGELLRATTAAHSSGLKIIASPPDIMPLESLSSDQVIDIVDIAAREFGTVFVDLPANWTNWSLSLLARSDLVLLVTELTVANLNGARRQLDFIRSQQFDNLQIRVVANRFEKKLMKTIRPSDVERVLGQEVAYTVANEPEVMKAATDRGVPISEIKRRSALGKSIEELDQGLAAALRLER